MVSSNSEVMKPYHILNVDDDVFMCQILRNLFEIHGFLVSDAYSTDQALNILNSRKIDIIVLNILTDSNSGFSLLKILRHISNTPAIVISPVDDDKFRIYCLELGAVDYLKKPVNFDELIHIVKHTLIIVSGN